MFEYILNDDECIGIIVGLIIGIPFGISSAYILYEITKPIKIKRFDLNTFFRRW